MGEPGAMGDPGQPGAGYGSSGPVDSILTADGSGGTVWKSTANLMSANFAGMVGIGTLSPQFDFHVFETKSTGTTFERFGGAAGISFQQADGTSAAPAASRTTLAQIRYTGYGATGFATSRVAMEIGAGEIWTDTAQGQFLQFYTTAKGTQNKGVKVRISSSGHVGYFADAAPALTACGTGPVTSAVASDTTGTITEGTGATGCTITFSIPYTAEPTCTITSRAGQSFSYAVTASGITITNIGVLAATQLDYHCFGYGDSAGPT